MPFSPTSVSRRTSQVGLLLLYLAVFRCETVKPFDGSGYTSGEIGTCGTVGSYDQPQLIPPLFSLSSCDQRAPPVRRQWSLRCQVAWPNNAYDSTVSFGWMKEPCQFTVPKRVPFMMGMSKRMS